MQGWITGSLAARTMTRVAQWKREGTHRAREVRALQEQAADSGRLQQQSPRLEPKSNEANSTLSDSDLQGSA